MCYCSQLYRVRRISREKGKTILLQLAENLSHLMFVLKMYLPILRCYLRNFLQKLVLPNPKRTHMFCWACRVKITKICFLLIISIVLTWRLSFRVPSKNQTSDWPLHCTDINNTVLITILCQLKCTLLVYKEN